MFGNLVEAMLASASCPLHGATRRRRLTRVCAAPARALHDADPFGVRRVSFDDVPPDVRSRVLERVTARRHASPADVARELGVPRAGADEALRSLALVAHARVEVGASSSENSEPVLYIFLRPAVVRLRLALARLWPVMASTAAALVRTLLPLAGYLLFTFSPLVAMIVLYALMAYVPAINGSWQAALVSASASLFGWVMFRLNKSVNYSVVTIVTHLVTSSLGSESQLLVCSNNAATREAVSLAADAAASPSGLLPTSRLATAGSAFVGAGVVAGAM